MAQLPDRGRPVLRVQQLEGSRRVLVLTGLAGPLAPVSWPARQRGDVSRAPGNARGRALLLGGEDEPTDLSFRWYTRRLLGVNDATLDGEVVEDADDLVRAVRAMVRESSIVEVRWRGEGRLGFLRAIDPSEGYAGEYEVDITIEWVAPEVFARSVEDAAATAKATSASTALEEYDAEQSTWVDVVRTLARPATAAASIVRDVEDAAEDVNDAFRRVGALGYDLTRGRATPTRVALAMSSAFVELSDASLAFGAAAGVGGADLAQTDEPRAVIGSILFRSAAQRQGFAAHRRGRLLAHRLSETTDPSLIGVHVAREGEDLRLVVLAWGYGTSDAWQDVARFNGLLGARLDAGQRVRMPRLGAVL